MDAHLPTWDEKQLLETELLVLFHLQIVFVMFFWPFYALIRQCKVEK